MVRKKTKKPENIVELKTIEKTKSEKPEITENLGMKLIDLMQENLIAANKNLLIEGFKKLKLKTDLQTDEISQDDIILICLSKIEKILGTKDTQKTSQRTNKKNLDIHEDVLEKIIAYYLDNMNFYKEEPIFAETFSSIINNKEFGCSTKLTKIYSEFEKFKNLNEVKQNIGERRLSVIEQIDKNVDKKDKKSFIEDFKKIENKNEQENAILQCLNKTYYNSNLKKDEFDFNEQLLIEMVNYYLEKNIKPLKTDLKQHLKIIQYDEGNFWERPAFENVVLEDEEIIFEKTISEVLKSTGKNQNRKLRDLFLKFEKMRNGSKKVKAFINLKAFINYDGIEKKDLNYTDAEKILNYFNAVTKEDEEILIEYFKRCDLKKQEFFIKFYLDNLCNIYKTCNIRGSYNIHETSEQKDKKDLYESMLKKMIMQYLSRYINDNLHKEKDYIKPIFEESRVEAIAKTPNENLRKALEHFNDFQGYFGYKDEELRTLKILDEEKNNYGKGILKDEEQLNTLFKIIKKPISPEVTSFISEKLNTCTSEDLKLIKQIGDNEFISKYIHLMFLMFKTYEPHTERIIEMMELNSDSPDIINNIINNSIIFFEKFNSNKEEFYKGFGQIFAKVIELVGKNEEITKKCLDQVVVLSEKNCTQTGNNFIEMFDKIVSFNSNGKFNPRNLEKCIVTIGSILENSYSENIDEATLEVLGKYIDILKNIINSNQENEEILSKCLLCVNNNPYKDFYKEKIKDYDLDKFVLSKCTDFLELEDKDIKNKYVSVALDILEKCNILEKLDLKTVNETIDTFNKRLKKCVLEMQTILKEHPILKRQPDSEMADIIPGVISEVRLISKFMDIILASTKNKVSIEDAFNVEKNIIFNQMKYFYFNEKIVEECTCKINAALKSKSDADDYLVTVLNTYNEMLKIYAENNQSALLNENNYKNENIDFLRLNYSSKCMDFIFESIFNDIQILVKSDNILESLAEIIKLDKENKEEIIEKLKEKSKSSINYIKFCNIISEKVDKNKEEIDERLETAANLAIESVNFNINLNKVSLIKGSNLEIYLGSHRQIMNCMEMIKKMKDFNFITDEYYEECKDRLKGILKKVEENDIKIIEKLKNFPKCHKVCKELYEGLLETQFETIQLNLNDKEIIDESLRIILSLSQKNKNFKFISFEKYFDIFDILKSSQVDFDKKTCKKVIKDLNSQYAKYIKYTKSRKEDIAEISEKYNSFKENCELILNKRNNAESQVLVQNRLGIISRFKNWLKRRKNNLKKFSKFIISFTDSQQPQNQEQPQNQVQSKVRSKKLPESWNNFLSLPKVEDIVDSNDYKNDIYFNNVEQDFEQDIEYFLPELEDPKVDKEIEKVVADPEVNKEVNKEVNEEVNKEVNKEVKKVESLDNITSNLDNIIKRMKERSMIVR